MAANAASGITVVDLAATRAEGFPLLSEIYSQVLIPSFRPDELDPLDVTERLLASEPSPKDVAAALGPDGRVVGAVVGDWDERNGVYLLSYLAAAPNVRNCGIGTMLMRHIQRRWRQRGTLVTLAEVDDPRLYAASAFGDPVARLRFYGRFGAGVLDLPYLQPRVRPRGSRVSGMLLLAFDIHSSVMATTVPLALRSSVLLSFMQDYFEDSEESAATDPEKSSFLSRLSAAPGIAILPITAYRQVAS